MSSTAPSIPATATTEVAPVLSPEIPVYQYPGGVKVESLTLVTYVGTYRTEVDEAFYAGVNYASFDRDSAATTGQGIARDIQDHPGSVGDLPEGQQNRIRALRQQLRVAARGAVQLVNPSNEPYNPEKAAGLVILDATNGGEDRKKVFMDLVAFLYAGAVKPVDGGTSKINASELLEDMSALLGIYGVQKADLISALTIRLPDDLKGSREFLAAKEDAMGLTLAEKLSLREVPNGESNKMLLQADLRARSMREMASHSSYASQNFDSANETVAVGLRSLEAELGSRIESVVANAVKMADAMRVQIEPQSIAMLEKAEVTKDSLEYALNQLENARQKINAGNISFEVGTDGQMRAQIMDQSDKDITATFLNTPNAMPAEKLAFFAWIAKEQLQVRSENGKGSISINEIISAVRTKYSGVNSQELMSEDLCRFASSKNGEVDPYRALVLLTYKELGLPYMYDSRQAISDDVRKMLKISEPKSTQQQRYEQFVPRAARMMGVTEDELKQLMADDSYKIFRGD